MTIFEDLRCDMSLREISRVSGISLSSLHFREKERRVKRLSPQIVEEIVRAASERPTYGSRRVWTVLRNGGTKVNRKAVRRVLRGRNLSISYAKHRGRTKHRNLFRPTGHDQLWDTDITYIPTEQGMTYLMAIKDCFTKEWGGYQYSRSCLSSDAIRAVEDAVVKAFEGRAPDGLVLRVYNGSQYIQKHTPEGDGNIESFHSSLKMDYVWPYEFQDYREASVATESAFTDYNETRSHSSIDYLLPRELRRKFLNDQSFRHSGKLIPGNSR